MLTKLNSLSLFGLSGEVVEVETDTHRGMPSFHIVGLGDTSIQESKERVRSAIKNSGFRFPGAKIAVNLAPADLKKQGPRFDLPMALGILHRTGQIDLPEKVQEKIFVGELGFSGELRGVTGILPTSSSAAKFGYKEIYVPAENAAEAALIPHIEVFPVRNLRQLCDHFSGICKIEPFGEKVLERTELSNAYEIDMAHIKGNQHGKRALEIAAAGGHNILMSGAPGSGKTMLAKSLATILPNLELNEALEITEVHSIAGLTNEKVSLIKDRPFRTVHHTASGIAIVGGGNPPRPGEISLAHRGVLFLDEFAEFPQKTLEVLRQPLEDGRITISRASGTCVFPAQLMLVAAMNPCPCGFYGDGEKECTCAPFHIQRYQNKISGPLLDRIDLHIDVPRISFEKLSGTETGEPSKHIRQRVQKAREIQNARFKKENITCNAEMSSALVKQYCVIGEDSKQLLKSAVEQMNLSGRAYYRILKLSRTIADLAGTEGIQMPHVAEAIGYRGKQVEA